MPGLRFIQMQNEPDLNGQAVDKEGKLVDELFAIGEVAEFGNEETMVIMHQRVFFLVGFCFLN